MSGDVIDDIAVVRSMYCHQTNHFPAVLEGATGKPLRQFEHPCLGSWVYYALGTANKDLPTFVNIGRPSSPVQLTGGYLGASLFGDAVSGRRCSHSESASAESRRPRRSATGRCRRSIRTEQAVPRGLRDRDARSRRAVKAFELAATMMLKAPAIVDFSTEPEHVKELYGIGEKETDDFGRQLLLARTAGRKTASASSRSAMRAAATAHGTRTTT